MVVALAVENPTGSGGLPRVGEKATMVTRRGKATMVTRRGKATMVTRTVVILLPLAFWMAGWR